MREGGSPRARVWAPAVVPSLLGLLLWAGLLGPEARRGPASPPLLEPRGESCGEAAPSPLPVKPPGGESSSAF